MKNRNVLGRIQQLAVFSRQIVFLFAIAQCYGLGQWVEQKSPANNTLKGIFFININEGWIVGQGGTILHTDNGGAIWQVQHTIEPINNFLYSVFFINPMRGWICGDSGIILRTSNGGISWEKIQYLSESTRTLEKIIFLDSLTGWICGNHFAGDYWAGGTLWKTNDGGLTWNILLQLDWMLTDYTGIINNISVIDYDHLWLAGAITKTFTFPEQRYYLMTTDGGFSWNTDTLPGNYFANSIQFKNLTHGWVLGGQGKVRLFRTINAGLTWNVTNLAVSNYTGRTPFYFVNLDTGYIVESSSSIFKTTTGGVTWGRQLLPTTVEQIYGIAFPDSIQGWIVGTNGKIYHTSDGGGFLPVKDDHKPLAFELDQNYPNPFNPSTEIRYQLPRTSQVKIVFYNVLGQELKVLVEERQTAGMYVMAFDGSKYSSGIYFYKLIADGFVATRKMLLIQ